MKNGSLLEWRDLSKLSTTPIQTTTTILLPLYFALKEKLNFTFCKLHNFLPRHVYFQFFSTLET